MKMQDSWGWGGVVLAVMLCMMSAAPDHAQATLTCPQVSNYVLLCLTYASSGMGQIPPACCAGVNSLNNAAQTTSDRQFACNCLKQLVHSLNLPHAGDIPAKCGLSLPYKMDPNIDCSTVS